MATEEEEEGTEEIDTREEGMEEIEEEDTTEEDMIEDTVEEDDPDAVRLLGTVVVLVPALRTREIVAMPTID